MTRLLTAALISSAALLAAAPSPTALRRPLVFEPNRGQAPPNAKWIAHGPGYQLQVTSDGITMLVRESAAGGGGVSKAPSPALARARPTYRAVRMTLEGSRSWTDLTGLEPTGGASNYLRGAKGEVSQANIPHYAKVKAAGVYEGIDLLFYDRGGSLEYDFVVAPGADPRNIRLKFEGMEQMQVDAPTGDLILTTSGGYRMRHVRPRVYQESGDGRVEIAGAYDLLGHGRAAFTLANYDKRRPVVIDPVVAFIDVFGGDANDDVNAIAVDAGGNSYITGETQSKDFPLLHQWDKTNNCDDHTLTGFCTGGTDGFVTKISPSGVIVFSTFFGNGDIDYGTGIAVDSSGVYVTGQWGVWFNHKDPSSGNLLILKLTLSGSRGYLYQFGSSALDRGNAIALDSHHNVWVTGISFAADFPTRDAEFSTYHTGNGDVFVVEVNPAGVVLFSELLAGTQIDVGYGITVDGDDNAWITGETCSPTFPGTNNFYLCSVFVTKFKGHRVAHTTLLPGTINGDQAGMAIAVDAASGVYVAGFTHNANFPTTSGAFQTGVGPSFYSGFVTRLSPAGDILNSTYLGGNGITNLYGIALDSASAVYVTGSTTGTSFPGAPALTPNPTTGFLTKLSPDLSTLFYTVILGNEGRGVAVLDAAPVVNSPHIYIAGRTQDPSKYTEVFVDMLEEGPFVRLRNFWQSNQYINIEGGAAASTPISPGWLSAQWELVLRPTTNGDPAGQNVFWIQNRWHPDQYLNIEAGHLQSSTIGPDWLSARWTFEPVPGTHLYRIRNVWQPNEFLNIESGSLVAGLIQTTGAPFPEGWWSAMWSIERPY